MKRRDHRASSIDLQIVACVGVRVDSRPAHGAGLGRWQVRLQVAMCKIGFILDALRWQRLPVTVPGTMSAHLATGHVSTVLFILEIKDIWSSVDLRCWEATTSSYDASTQSVQDKQLRHPQGVGFDSCLFKFIDSTSSKFERADEFPNMLSTHEQAASDLVNVCISP